LALMVRSSMVRNHVQVPQGPLHYAEES
jgi:hypothetical protein